MSFYSQTDPRYALQLLGFNVSQPYTIGNFGCVITAVANLMVAASGDQGYTPELINNWGKSHGGFLLGGGIWSWPATVNLGHVTARGTTADFNAAKAFLAPAPNFAIFEVNASGRQHFVLANTQSTIIDSQDGRSKGIKTYPFKSAHLFTATALPQAAPQAPAAAPTGGPVNETVTVRVPLLNTRFQPTTASPIGPTLHAGTVHVNAWIKGQSVTINGRTDDVWLKTDGGHWFTQAATTK